MIEAHRTLASRRNTSLSSPEFHPRHRFGKWAQAGVPHTGWQCLFINDLGEQDHICQMCELQEVRYVHHMRHPDYPGVLEVGCECAADMEQSHESATSRVRSMKNRAERRDNWLTRKWSMSANGNPWLKTQGRRVVIRRKGAAWTFTVARDDAPPHHEAATFSTPDQAKLAAFDFIWPAVLRSM